MGINKRSLILLIFIIFLSFFNPFFAYSRRLYYAEEFYLYVLNLYYTNPNLERNIRFMQWALQAPFDNPVRSLAIIKTEKDFNRYKALFKMHVNMLIIDSYLQLGRRFDKEHLYFFNLTFAEELKESFSIAKYYYQISHNYWAEVKNFAQTLDSMPGRISIEQWEDELNLIQTGELDYERIINEQLARLESKILTLEEYLAKLEFRSK